MVTDEPTKKQLKKDFNALEKGKKDGEIIIKNVSPKTTGGKREIIGTLMVPGTGGVFY
jgi:hypothetical protein